LLSFASNVLSKYTLNGHCSKYNINCTILLYSLSSLESSIDSLNFDSCIFHIFSTNVRQIFSLIWFHCLTSFKTLVHTLDSYCCNSHCRILQHLDFLSCLKSAINFLNFDCCHCNFWCSKVRQVFFLLFPSLKSSVDLLYLDCCHGHICRFQVRHIFQLLDLLSSLETSIDLLDFHSSICNIGTLQVRHIFFQFLNLFSSLESSIDLLDFHSSICNISTLQIW